MQRATKRRSPREREMQLLVSRFEEEAEQERRKIARQLHDDIGQNLTLLVFLLDQIRRSLGKQSSEEIAQAQEIAGELIARVRDISLQVRPAIPEGIGLLPTLEASLQELKGKTGSQPGFRHSGLEKELPPHIATAAYLIMQKAASCLNGKGRQLGIVIKVTGKSVNISVSARGDGCEAASDSGEMQWIRYRTEYLGGTFNLASTPGRSTRMTVRLPLPKPIDNTR